MFSVFSDCKGRLVKRVSLCIAVFADPSVRVFDEYFHRCKVIAT